MVYPDHIYEPVRIELAEQLLEKELLKLFPIVAIDQLSQSVKSWRLDPSGHHLEDSIRDFWDIFAAVTESIKLKPSFTSFITADNYHWEMSAINVREIQISSPLDQMKRLPAFKWTTSTTIGDVLDAIPDEKTLREQKDTNDHHSSPGQDVYPIVARQLPDGSIKVMDGNRRALRAGLYDKMQISAWVAHADQELPANHWVPVNDILQLVKLYRLAHSDVEKQAVRNSLELLFRSSHVVRINYEKRISGSNKWADELLTMASTL